MKRKLERNRKKLKIKFILITGDQQNSLGRSTKQKEQRLAYTEKLISGSHYLTKKSIGTK
jgi:hypothetical protein